MNNIADIEQLFLSSPKTDDSLIVPIGYNDNGKAKELSFSCRGTVLHRSGVLTSGNANGYSVRYSLRNEGINLMSGLAVNLCKKYSPDEALISYYNFSDDPQSSVSFIEKLPNANRICHSAIDEQFEIEIQRLKEIYKERYRIIDKYSSCYARAVNEAKQKGESIGLPQEILLIHFPQRHYEYQQCNQIKNHIFFLTQELWRVGIYPIAFFDNNTAEDDFMEASPYFSGNIFFWSSSHRILRSHHLFSDQVMLALGWDSWDETREGNEIFNLPHYSEDWVSANIALLNEGK